MDDAARNVRLTRAIEALDDDREAEPLLALYRRRVAAKAEAEQALVEARRLVTELEQETAALSVGVAELEQRIIALAEKRGAEEVATASCTEPLEPERIREIHGRIERVTRVALERARAAGSAKPGAPIAAERLRPGITAGAAFRTPIGAGVKGARREAERMIGAQRKRSKAGTAEE